MIKLAIISFVIGFFAVGVFLYGAAFALALFADVQKWGSFSIGLGPFTLFEHIRTSNRTQNTFGNGIMMISLLAGFFNAVVALLLRKRV